MDGTDARLLWLGAVTVALWLASRGYELWREWRIRARDRDSYLRALFAEIDFNARDLRDFLSRSPDMHRLQEALADPNLVPHITDARHTQIYSANLDMLHHLDDRLIQDVVDFFGGLEKIRSQIEGVARPSYKTISVPGQTNVLRILFETCERCMLRGETILRDMQREYRTLRLARHRTSLRGSREDLATRLARLGSDLDRVRSGHRGVPPA